MSDPVLSFRISASYGKREVLHDAAESIAPGEIVSLVGLSGSGKSTLALALLRLLKYRGGAVQGSILLEGVELIGLSESELRRIRGKRLAYVPQNPASALNPLLRVRSLLNETWRSHAAGVYPANLLESVQLPVTPAFLDQRAGELSTGQGQRLLVALAIMHSPAVLIADEPTSALDAINQAALLKLFVKLNQEQGAAILFISHDLLSVAAVSHRIAILHEGRIVETGTPQAVFHSPQHEFTRTLVAAMPRVISS